MTIDIKGFQKEVSCTIAGKAPSLVERPFQIWRTELCLCRGGSHNPAWLFPSHYLSLFRCSWPWHRMKRTLVTCSQGRWHISTLSLYTYVFENPLCHDQVFPELQQITVAMQPNSSRIWKVNQWSLDQGSCDQKIVMIKMFVMSYCCPCYAVNCPGVFCIFVLTCSDSDSENISWNNNRRGQAWSGAKHEGWYLIFLSKLIMALFFSFGCYQQWTVLNIIKSTRSGCEREGNKAHCLLANTKRKRRPVAQSQPDHIWKWRNAGTTHIVF